MSHVATHWLATVPPTDLTHGEFRVLFHLCDCHNPAHGCFPKQAHLMAVTGLSKSGLNKALGALVEKGLLERHASRDPRTNRQNPTRYILGFEILEPQEPGPLSGPGNDEAGSTTVDSGRVHYGGPYIDAEPVREEPVREEEERVSARGETSFEDFFAELLAVFGFPADQDLPVWWQGQGARMHVSRWLEALGLSEDQVLDVARRFRAQKPDLPQGPKALDRAMEREAKPPPCSKAKKKAQPTASDDEIAQRMAEWILSDKYIPPNGVSSRALTLVVERGLVPEERLKERGLW